MTTKHTACLRCGTAHILDGGRCVRCRQDSEREFALVEAARLFGRVLVWFRLEAWARMCSTGVYVEATTVENQRAYWLELALLAGEDIRVEFVR